MRSIRFLVVGLLSGLLLSGLAACDPRRARDAGVRADAGLLDAPSADTGLVFPDAFLPPPDGATPLDAPAPLDVRSARCALARRRVHPARRVRLDRCVRPA